MKLFAPKVMDSAIAQFAFVLTPYVWIVTVAAEEVVDLEVKLFLASDERANGVIDQLFFEFQKENGGGDGR